MVYKIALVSTHGTGKTALAGLIEGELKRRNIEARAIREMSTQARERGLPINEQTTKETQLWILYRQFAEELLHSQPRQSREAYQVIICDRGPDNYCYLKHRCGDDPLALNLTLGHLQQFPYNQLYLLPIVDEQIVDDGTRSVDDAFQQAMDTEIRAFFIQHDIATVQLPLPQKDDHLRNEWVKIIVNQTLTDLNVDTKYFIS